MGLLQTTERLLVLSLVWHFVSDVWAQSFYGIAYSPYRQYGACPTKQNLHQDYEILKRHTRRVRLYSTECHLLNDIALQAATDGTVEVLLGLWIDNNAHRNGQELQDLYTYLRKYPHARLLGITVGNEVLYRGSMQPSALAGLVTEVKNRVRQIGMETGSYMLQTVPVYSVDVIPHPFVVAVSDAIGVNVHPFYKGGLTDNAPQYLWAQRALEGATELIRQFRASYPGKEIVVTETGWPSSSTRREANRGNLQVAVEYREKFRQWANADGLKYFMFELVDSPWKVAQYPHEPTTMSEFHWGLYDSNRMIKQ